MNLTLWYDASQFFTTRLLGLPFLLNFDALRIGYLVFVDSYLAVFGVQCLSVL